MQRLLFLIIILIPYLAIAVDFRSTTPPPNVTVTPPPRFNFTAINAVSGCASNDCNDYHSTVRDPLPDPSPVALEPSSGVKENFCRDVNVENVPDLCTKPKLMHAPKSKHRRKRKILGS